MKVGTRSVLYGAHCFFLHPWFVAWAWKRLYGFPLDPRLWTAFFVHDLGYIGKPNMDGSEGETHPLLGARIMSYLFDRHQRGPWIGAIGHIVWNVDPQFERERDRRKWVYLGRWGSFVLLHSRFLAKRSGLPYSRLCVADKLALALTPAWLYLPMARATGEIREYMRLADERTVAGEPRYAAQGQHRGDEEVWYAQVQEYMRRWVDEHWDGREDTWTPNMGNRKSVNSDGVWQ